MPPRAAIPRTLLAVLLVAALGVGPALAAREARSHDESEAAGLIRAAFYNEITRDLARVEKLFRLAIERARQHAEVDHELGARLLLSNFLGQIGRPRDALVEIDAASTFLEQNPGEWKIDAAVLGSFKAYIVAELGRYREAQDLWERSIKLRQTTAELAGGDQTDDLVVSVSEMGLSLVATMRDDAVKGRELALKSLQATIRRHPHNEFFTLPHKLVLAIAEDRLGEHDKALRLARAVYADACDYLRVVPLHVGSLVSATGLMLWHLGMRKEAGEAYRRSTAALEKVLGKDNLRLVPGFLGMGMAALAEQRLDDAEELGKRCMAIVKRELGGEHPFMAATLELASRLKLHRGQAEKAEELALKSLSIDEQVYGPDHSSLAHSHEYLAAVRAKLGRHAEAKASLEAARRIRGRNYPADHPSMRRLDRALEELSKPTE